MAVSVAILSWNIQILGETKISRLLRPNILSAVIVQRGADIVALQAPGYNHGSQAATEPIAARNTRHGNTICDFVLRHMSDYLPVLATQSSCHNAAERLDF